jgi:hypothetical protein
LVIFQHGDVSKRRGAPLNCVVFVFLVARAEAKTFHRLSGGEFVEFREINTIASRCPSENSGQNESFSERGNVDWRENGTDVIPALKHFLRQWLSTPARSMFRLSISRSYGKELHPAYGDWTIERVMAWSSSHQNNQDVHEDAHPVDPSAGPISAHEELDAIWDRPHATLAGTNRPGPRDEEQEDAVGEAAKGRSVEAAGRKAKPTVNSGKG